MKGAHKMDELIKKINDEIQQNEKDVNIKRIGEYILSLVPKLDDKTIAEMMAEDKTIKGSIKKMQQEARKVAVNGCGILTDEEGYKIVREYFSITDKAASVKIIDLNEYL
jgi:Zn/Cd-binding protein ZinT